METWEAPFLARAERIGLEFEARFYGEVLRHTPTHVEALAELGQVLTRLERYEEGLEVDRRLVELVPENPTAHYNLACSYALCGRREEALDALETAERLGYADRGHLLADEDLASLRSEPRFQALVARLSEAPG